MATDNQPRLIFTFKTVRAQQSFLMYLKQVTDGRQHNPSVALMLEQLAEPVIVITADTPDEE